MKSFLASLLLVVASPVFADNGFSWEVLPGPNGTIRVSTSAGTYIVDIDGNSGWVGTEQEYEARRIGGVLRSEGFHEMKIKGQNPNIHQVVSNALPSTAVGSTNVGDISTTIYFGTAPDKKLHRPPKQADSEYVGSVWTQSDKTEIVAKIADMENGKTYAPYYCHSIPNFNMRTCEFVIPRESLIHHSALLLASAKGRPGAIQMESIVKQHNQVLLYKYKPLMGSRFALNKEDAATMQSLHGLDNGVATTLPPLPPGVKELRSECKIESQEITQAQYDAVTTGENIERLECDFGESANVVASTRGWHLLDYEWKMKSGGYAFVTVAPSEAKTVIEKHAIK